MTVRVGLTGFNQSGCLCVSDGGDGAAVANIIRTACKNHRALDVVQVLLRLLDFERVWFDHFERRAGEPGELRHRVDLLGAAGDPVIFLLNVDFTDRSCKRFTLLELKVLREI